MDMKLNSLSRRSLLSSLGIGASAFAASQWMAPMTAQGAGNDEAPLFVFGYFSGAWDTLLSLDPRSSNEANSQIDPAYETLAANDLDLAAVLQANPGGIVQAAGGMELGPAIGELAQFASDICVVRGINMGTLTHEVGRRHFLTGKFPRGLQASGSALPTAIVDQSPAGVELSNLVMGVETYNEGLDPAASGIVVQRATDLEYLMRALNPAEQPSAELSETMRSYHDLVGCRDARLNNSGMVDVLNASRNAASQLASGDLWQYFDFNSKAPLPEVSSLLSAFGYAPNLPVQERTAIEQAMVAGQALKMGISQAVSITLAEGIDHHDDDYQTDHSTALRSGFTAAARLINFLKTTEDANGKKLWDRTVLMLFSEFARTPRLNSRGGRDHHIANACVVGGRGIAGGKVIGGTGDDYGVRPVDLASGEVTSDGSGHEMRPPDVHATVLKAMGLSYDHLSNQDPVIIDAMLSS
jgi:uncharacterized protein (DUF1501 family)